MNPRTTFISAIVVVAIILFALVYSRPTQKVVKQEPLASVSYICNAGKTIAAVYYKGDSKPAPSADLPPTPGGNVVLTLSDGRTMTLPQTISADGGRYANADESFVFWSKGNGALVLENNQEKSYIGCILAAAQPEGSDLTQAYANSTYGFSLRTSEGYVRDESYRYIQRPGRDISGIKFTIPSSVATGTNLSSDSYVSVEELPQATACSAQLFLDQAVRAETIVDRDITYSVASTTGAGAGNRYYETVYALPGTNPCIAVRYFIHYGVIENYPAGLVREFDEPALIAQFDAIRRTLIIAH